jgi:plastocyanin
VRRLLATLAVAAAGAIALAPAAGAGGKAKTIEVGANAYSPAKQTIKKGQKLRFHWSGGFDVHDVNVAKGPSKFHSPLQAAGTWVHKFKKPGTYALFCTQHPEMTMVVKVKKR